MGTEGKKETTSNASKRQVSLHNGAEGSAALQLCHSGTLWQNALLQLAGAPEGTRPGGHRPGGSHPAGTLAPHAHRDGMAGAEQPVVPSTATSQCPAAGTTHPHGVRQDAHPAQTSAGMGLGYWQARWPSPARLGCSGSVRVSGRRGLCGDVERGVCVCVCWFSPPGADPE